ncbi:MAG: hypothetical protein IT455_13425 [Planctomycetes bacterium]|nr:hypothetical protein [Planctomycetota bacterium]
MLGVARWFFTFLGGVLLGGGLVLHGQVAVALPSRHVRVTPWRLANDALWQAVLAVPGTCKE